MQPGTVRTTLAVAALLASTTAAATTHMVTNLTDANPGSLRQRIQIAAAGDTIAFAPSGTGYIQLASELAIGRDLTILGPSAQMLTLYGSGSHRIFNVLAGTVAISGLRVYFGRALGTNGAPGEDGGPGRGGGILNAGTLTLSEVLLDDCGAYGGNGTASHSLSASGGPGEGGGIYNAGTLTLVGCTATQCHSGGGSGDGSFSFPAGRGVGGLGRGGAIFNAGSASLVNCTLASNEASGGFAPNMRGGDGRGGAILNASSLGLNHCTIAANTASGGIGATNGDGKGGGLYGDASVVNTIVALNAALYGAPVGPDVLGSFASQGHNLIGKVDGSGGWVASDQLGTIASPLDPNLQSLTTASGGPTPTRRPMSGSAAIDRGGPGGPAIDQTGHPRPYDDPSVTNVSGGDGSDIGAVEAQPPRRFIVTHLGDPGSGSLRRAVETAATGDSVGFQSVLSGTIALPYGTLYLYRSLVLAGPGADIITVSGNGAATVLRIYAPITASRLTLTGAADPMIAGLTPRGCVYAGYTNVAITLEGCAITGNNTTGIVTMGPLTVRNSTVAGNTSGTGVGGIEAANVTTLENCTVSGNSGPTVGGIWLSQNYARSLSHCTIADNHQTASVVGAGGIYNQQSASAAVGGTVIAGNTSPQTFQRDIRGTFSSQGFNLIGVNGGTWTPATGDQVGSVTIPLDPMLGPLADNGGATLTMVPLSGSPLIDRAIALGLATDQRGAARPYDDVTIPNPNGADGSDVGATEWLPGPLEAGPSLPRLGTGLVAAAPSPFRTDVALTLAFARAGEAELVVHSVDGRRVRTLARGHFDAGTHRVTWDGRDDSGRDVPSGVYFARLRSPEGTFGRSLVRIR